MPYADKETRRLASMKNNASTKELLTFANVILARYQT